MARTPEEQAAWEIQAYGVPADDIHRWVRGALGSPRLTALSILSDAQEESDKDRVRQKINVAKFIINEYLVTKDAYADELRLREKKWPLPRSS